MGLDCGVIGAKMDGLGSKLGYVTQHESVTGRMNILIFPDASRATRHTADLIAAAIRAKPHLVLGLATGSTMRPVHAGLVAQYAAGDLSFAQVTTFNLDEYIGLPATHPGTFAQFMAETLFEPTDIDIARTHLPDGMAPDPVIEAARYETLIRAKGGIDLQVLGIGINGHIGFNEPGSAFGSRTRPVALATSTIATNRAHFANPDEMPTQAITMGIATIGEARTCVLLAHGTSKAQAIAAMIEGPISTDCPASCLQSHRDVTVILDESAARLLSTRIRRLATT
ncbi:MAG: glucosamine-6-phosphate deaminase [Roseinatronobacter sp.]